MAKERGNLERQFQDLEKQYKKVPKRKWMFRLATLLFIIFSFGMTIVLSIVRDNAKEKILNDYITSIEYDSLKILYDNIGLRGNMDAYNWYKDNFLGMDINVALAGKSRNCSGNTDNKNCIGNVEAYTNKDSKLIIKIDDKRVFFTENIVTEILATPADVFYIDETDGNTVHRYNIECAAEETFISDPVEQFFIYGNYIFALGKDEKIKRVSLDTKESIDLADNVQRMFVSDGVLVQSGTKIIKISFDGISNSEMITNALLVGADDKHIYYTNFGVSVDEMPTSVADEAKENSEGVSATDEGIEIDKTNESNIQGKYVLYAMNIETKKITPIDGRDSFIRAVYITEEGILVDTME